MTIPQHKPICLIAVASIFAALLSTSAFVFAPLIVVAIFTIPMSLLAVRTIRKYELSGRNLSMVAMAVATLSAAGSPAWHGYLSVSETLPGYARVRFDPEDTGALDSLDGKKVCVKGYSLYFGGDPEVRSFLLSPDGNYRKETAAITVVLSGSWRHEYDPIAVSGILRVDPSSTVPRKRYTLSAVKVSTAKTSDKLAARSSEGC